MLTRTHLAHVHGSCSPTRAGDVGGFGPATRRADGGGFRPATRPGLAPAGEVLLVDAKSTQKRLLNVHVRRGVQRHSTRCVHPLAALSRKVAPSVHGRRDGNARSTLHDRDEVPPPCHRQCLTPTLKRGVQPRLRHAPRHAQAFAPPECSVSVATAHVHGWSSTSVQSSGGEHTVSDDAACHGEHGPSKDVFGSFWRLPKGPRLPGRDPAGWQGGNLQRQRARWQGGSLQRQPDGWQGGTLQRQPDAWQHGPFRGMRNPSALAPRSAPTPMEPST
jgi:hypothetical protein